METRRLITFLALTVGFLLVWNTWIQPSTPPVPLAQQEQTNSAVAAPGAVGIDLDAEVLKKGERISVATDLFRAEIDTVGGDIRQMSLFQHRSSDDKTKPFVLFSDDKDHVYIAQSGFLPSNTGLPDHKTVWETDTYQYQLTPDQDEVVVLLHAKTEKGVLVTKTIKFHRNSYLIDVSYNIENKSAETLKPETYFRILRDGNKPEGSSYFVHTYFGPVLFTEEEKGKSFKKISFDDLKKGKTNFPQTCNNGWVGMVQHYFTTVWMPPTRNKGTTCTDQPDRRFDIRAQKNGLFTAGVIYPMPEIAPGQIGTVTVPLFAGPQEHKRLEAIGENIKVTKDFGIFSVIATPLFWVLVHLHSLVGNWGWAIILLTILLKILFWLPTASSYRSMAKMRDVAPRMQRLKEQFGDDRQKMSQAMMELYKTEKINPLGGCLPMIIQIPIFMGLYWCLLQSVELRQAPWEFWIADLSQKDPYYILPALMAVSMWYQTTLSPAPADPMQAKMMKIMPLMFSVFFFFSPSGLVLYWFTNNLLSISQQKLIYRQLEKAKAEKAKITKA